MGITAALSAWLTLHWERWFEASFYLFLLTVTVGYLLHTCEYVSFAGAVRISTIGFNLFATAIFFHLGYGTAIFEHMDHPYVIICFTFGVVGGAMLGIFDR